MSEGQPDEAVLVTSLYAAPLGEFIARRKEASALLRKAGKREAAARVKALTKPTPAAWAANALQRERRAEWDAMVEAAGALRAAQAAGGMTPQQMQHTSRRNAARSASYCAKRHHCAKRPGRNSTGDTRRS